jgi:hypothetical protein
MARWRRQLASSPSSTPSSCACLWTRAASTMTTRAGMRGSACILPLFSFGEGKGRGVAFSLALGCGAGSRWPRLPMCKNQPLGEVSAIARASKLRLAFGGKPTVASASRRFQTPPRPCPGPPRAPPRSRLGDVRKPLRGESANAPRGCLFHLSVVPM